jgi:hypothetical protein
MLPIVSKSKLFDHAREGLAAANRRRSLADAVRRFDIWLLALPGTDLLAAVRTGYRGANSFHNANRLTFKVRGGGGNGDGGGGGGGGGGER